MVVAGVCAFGSQTPAHSHGRDSDGSQRTTFYFLRHAEDIEESVLQGILDPSCSGTCCEAVLNDLGAKRAELWAEWFSRRKLLDRLTHVIASHKIRTLQTAGPIAAAAIAQGARLAEDADLQPQDGVQQVPARAKECGPGFESSASSREPMTELLRSLPPGSQALVAAHSPTIYPILEAFGIDTSDPIKFPRDDRGRVSGFGNLWIVQVDASGNGRLRRHLVLDFELATSRGDD